MRDDNNIPIRAGFFGKTYRNASEMGWIVLQVEQANSKPVMFFDPAAGGAMGVAESCSSSFAEVKDWDSENASGRCR